MAQSNQTNDQKLATDEAQSPSGDQVHQVSAADLPLSCPMPNMPLWNAHPRVYLPIEETGKAQCPYCGAEYVLSDPAD